MDRTSTNRPLETPRQHHLSINTQVQSASINDSDPGDGFFYSDYGPSQTPSKKREKPRSPHSPQESHISADTDDVLDTDELAERLERNIYEKETKGTRARFPDQGQISNIGHDSISGTTSLSIPSSSSLKKKHKRRWPRSETFVANAPRTPDQTKLRRVMLSWSTKRVDGEQQFVLDADVVPAGAETLSQNAIIWQHSNYENASLDEFESLVARLTCAGLQEGAIGLTRRLLKRVKLVAERAFVGGSFLTPTTIRYDMLDASKFGVDKCCIFLNFPYFAVEKAKKMATFKKGDSRHPTRSLLQSRYRLNETVERDDSQCIRMLSADSLESCIKAKDTSRLCGKSNDERIYIPQIWAMITGLDHMVTAGPISDQGLQGRAIALKDKTLSEASNKCKLVRIDFINRGMPEDILYPIDQCACWFGLLNKHQQIRNALRRAKEKTEPREYQLWIGQQKLDAKSWASVQRSADGEIIELWMETPKPPKVTVRSAGGNTSSDGRQVSGTDDDSLAHSRPGSSHLSNDFRKLDPIPISKALLAWRVVDDFGETYVCPTNVQTKRFLDAIYALVPATCVEQDINPTSQSTKAMRSAAPNIQIQGRLSRDVDSIGLARSDGKKEASVEQNIWWKSVRLFNCFIPDDYDITAAPVRLYWGTICELMNGDHQQLYWLLSQLKTLICYAEQLHLGVHLERIGTSKGGFTEYKDDISESAILLASVVDALGAIFNMLVEAVNFLRLGHSNHRNRDNPLGDQAASYSEEACRLLQTARDQLITEATGTPIGEDVGPVVTPEAILIMTLDRLVRGVFDTGYVDVINILEECLEQLALRVEKHSSRRLLQKLNAFEEEVDVVNDVLLQQTKVLIEFRNCLNPVEFKKPTTARKMRFAFEKQAIEKILIHIQEQLRHCKELRERAKVLAVQNVQLVETLADDNGRAIFVFTFITVLFLPLSFVAGFFGMNLAGVSDSDSRVSRFWYIAVPLTVGIWILCAVFVTWGESIWFAAVDLPRLLKAMMVKNKK